MTRSVLHVTQPTDGGVASYVISLARAQMRLGWVPHVACPRHGPLAARLMEEGIHHAPWTATRSPGVRVPAETASLAKVIRSVRPDIVHLHSSKAGLAGRLMGRRGAAVFQPHGWSWDALPPLFRPTAVLWERLSASRVDSLICVSRDELAAGKRRGLRANWVVVPNGVDLLRFREAGPGDRAEAREALGLSEDPHVLCVGSVRHAKGQDVLLAAWPQVLERAPSARLVIVGDGPDRASLESRAPRGVLFLGERSDVERWLTAADVVAVPSRREGMSLAMLEAMAVGRSIVATDVPGAREALEPEAGAIVAPEDPGALAAEIVTRLSRPEMAVAEGRAGRRRAAERYDFDRTIHEILEVYEDILRRHQT